MAPLKMMYSGRRGKAYRRRLAAIIVPRTKPLPDIVRDMRQMLQEMNFANSGSSSEAESDAEQDKDESNSTSASGCA
jgi:tRNA-dihydrouridine synthase A